MASTYILPFDALAPIMLVHKIVAEVNVGEAMQHIFCDAHRRGNSIFAIFALRQNSNNHVMFLDCAYGVVIAILVRCTIWPAVLLARKACAETYSVEIQPKGRTVAAVASNNFCPLLGNPTNLER